MEGACGYEAAEDGCGVREGESEQLITRKEIFKDSGKQLTLGDFSCKLIWYLAYEIIRDIFQM